MFLCHTFSFPPSLGQLGKLQADMEALREQRESTICTTREELYSAQEEVPFLPVLSPRILHDIWSLFNHQFKKIVTLT